MKKTTIVILLLAITALCFGNNNLKKENKLFGLNKSEIASDAVKVSETISFNLFSDVITWGTNVVGYMAINEIGLNTYSVYAETEASWGTGDIYMIREQYRPDFLEVYLTSNQGLLLGYNSRSDGGWLVWVETLGTSPSGYWGTHKSTLDGITYECQTSI